MSERVLVTGAAGFIGGYVVDELLTRGYEVVGIDNLSKYGKVVKSYDSDANYTFVEGDCRDVDLMTRLALEVDHLIAGAALIGGISYFHTYAYDLLAVNERIMGATCDAAIEAHKGGRLQKVTYISSSMVFESTTHWPSAEGDERKIPPPLSSYGFQKLAVEYFARAAWDQYQLPFTIVRPFNCVGIGERRAVGDVDVMSGNVKLAMSHVVPDLVQKIVKGQDPLHILGDGSQVRHYTYGGDLARGIVDAMSHADARNDDFNLSTSESTTVLELAEAIWRKVHSDGRAFNYVSDPGFEHDVQKRVPATDKAKRVLGFEAATTLDEMLDEVIPWIVNAVADGTIEALDIIRREKRALFALGVISIASVCLRWMVPINPTGIAVGAFDQGLYERLAASIRRGEWLGEFSKTTLAKGPGYSLFMAYTAKLHIPLSVAHQLSYLAGALAVAGAVYLLTRRPGVAVCAYAVLAFDPVNFGSLAAAVTRENVYTGFALVFVVGCFLAISGALRQWRWYWLLAVAVVTGLAGAAFWLCREEGIWVGPSLALIGAVVPGVTRGAVAALTAARTAALSLLLVAAAIAATFVLPIRVVHHRNAKLYGVGLTTDFASGNFAAAYSSWTRVRGVKLRKYVPVDAAQRRAVYRVSAAAREIEPFLEDPKNGWKMWACPKDPNTAIRGATHINICDDYPGGAAPWAFRDAALVTGHYDDAADLQQFYGRIDRDIRAACDDGRLKCSRALPAGAQFAERAHPTAVARSAWRWLGELVDGPYVFDLYGPNRVNVIPASERPEVKNAVVGAADSNVAARRAAQRFHDRRYPHLILGWIYKLLAPLLLVAAVVKLIASAVRRRGLGSDALVLAGALAGGAVVRLIMFSVIDTTQYFNEMRYQLATRTFLFAAAR